MFASPDYLKRRGTPHSPEKLSHHETLLFDGGSLGPTLSMKQEQTSTKVSISPRLRANNVFAVREACVSGLGIAQLPIVVADPSVQAGLLHRVLALWILPSVPVHAVFASARYLTPKVRSFVDLAAEAMQSNRQGI